MNLSITIPVYERYKQTYQKKKEQLTRKGITSFAGYITSTLEEMMEKNEVFARCAPFMQEFGFDEGTNTIYIKDNRTNRIAGVTRQGEGVDVRHRPEGRLRPHRVRLRPSAGLQSDGQAGHQASDQAEGLSHGVGWRIPLPHEAVSERGTALFSTNGG